MIEGLSGAVKPGRECKRRLVFRDCGWRLAQSFVDLAEQVMSAEGGAPSTSSPDAKYFRKYNNGVGKVAITEEQLVRRVEIGVRRYARLRQGGLHRLLHVVRASAEAIKRRQLQPVLRRFLRLTDSLPEAGSRPPEIVFLSRRSAPESDATWQNCALPPAPPDRGPCPVRRP